MFIGSKLLLPAGYLGVDIFFVISGFLITSKIINMHKNPGGFSCIEFYERRLRRLLPALLVVMLVSIPFALQILFPEQLVDYGKSLIATLFFSGNIHWYFSQQLYGAESGLMKPFLHMWSIGVEEQYYLFYPFFLMILFRWFKNHVIKILCFGILISFSCAYVLAEDYEPWVFYMLPTRLWELLVGGGIAFVPARKSFNPKELILKQIVSIVGIMMIFGIILIPLNTASSLVSALVVIGTGLVIFFSFEENIITKLLSNKFFVGIGLISYSLYIWHYPIFVFLRFHGLFDTNLSKLAGIFLTFIVSVLSFKYIETPFRNSKIMNRKIFLICILTASSMIFGLSLGMVKSGGWPNRFGDVLASGAIERWKLIQKYWNDTSKYYEVKNFTDNETSIVVIGNSWAQDIANGLIEAGIKQVYYSGMTGHECVSITLPRLDTNHERYKKVNEQCSANNKFFQSDYKNAQLLIIADDATFLNFKDKQAISEVWKNIRTVKKHGYLGPILLIGNRPMWNKSAFSILRDYGSDTSGVNQYAQKFLSVPLSKMKTIDKKAKNIYEIKDGIYYFSLVPLFCKTGICTLVHNRSPLYYDHTHLTISGAKYIGESLVHYIQSTIIK